MYLFFALLLPFCALSQVTEPFNNPEISYKYDWEGDADRFKIEDGFLRLFDSSIARTASLYIYGVSLADNEWNLRLKSDYKTTNYNSMRVYLWCNSTNIESERTGYYIELGGDKKISLCKVWGLNAKESLISRQIDNLEKAYDIHIRVVSDHEKITLYARSDSKPEFTEIGSTDYEFQANPGYFILYAKYSKDHAKDKYFGPITIRNFSTGTSPVPEEKPAELTLQSVEQEDASTLILTFNQSVNPIYASFSLSALGEAEQIYISEDERIIKLVWPKQMEKGETYILSYKDLYDNHEKKPNSGSYSFVAIHTTTVQPEIIQYSTGDLIINEVMANPNGAMGLPETEYVELYNTTDKEINLTGWSFIYADKGTSLQSTVPEKGYAVLYREGRDITVDKDGIAIPSDKFPSALANTGKQIQLKSNDGSLIDEITYPTAKAGFSWERIEDSWQLSSDQRGGTPGSVNSTQSSEPEKEEEERIIIMPGEVVFSELLPEPQEGGSEYIELYNRSDRALPLSDLSIAVRKNDNSLNTNYSLSSISDSVEPGEYALLTKSIAGVRDFFLIQSPESLHELKLPVLANTSARLVLFRTKDTEVIDEIHYTDKWHSISTKNRKGIALERIDINGDTQDPDNWTSASTLSGGGTPGYKNSQTGEISGGGSTGIDMPEYNPATGDYSIAYQLDRTGYLCRANVYDTSGRKIAEILNHELLGSEGIISWDGFASGGNKIVAGIYIFHAELYHPQGGRKIYKKVFLVR